jgi:hypothetical protein
MQFTGAQSITRLPHGQSILARVIKASCQGAAAALSEDTGMALEICADQQGKGKFCSPRVALSLEIISSAEFD